jgi:hypothetical protein
MRLQESTIAINRRARASTPHLFNIDLHASVIRDLEMGLSLLDAQLTRWSLSFGNRHFRHIFKWPDPVEFVNESTWRSLDSNLIDRFQSRYGPFLRSFDGFVITYPPAFSELFSGLNKPTLVVAATRYEAPFTGNAGAWASLDAYLLSESLAGRMVVAANNRADRDYMEWHSGLRPVLTPSLCDYTGTRWAGPGGPRVFFCRSEHLSERIRAVTHGAWIPAQEALGRNYSWSSLARCSAVLVIPYNVSTMTLFELATSGVPVVVPDPNLMLELMGQYEGVLSELLFDSADGGSHPVEGGPADRMPFADPRWWLDRADFYDSGLMPNVTTITRLEELVGWQPLSSHVTLSQYRLAIETRNRTLATLRQDLLGSFLDLV